MTDSRSHLPRRKHPTALFLPPPMVHQRYKLGREIGSGGFARVYHAWDTGHQGESVVLKRAHLSTHAETMLRTEAETLSRLHHPAIPTWIDYVEEAGFSYLVETRMKGTSMQHLRFFEMEQILWIGRRLCEVLEYLHRQHLVHRDIAPGNILLDWEHQTLALLDFGLARAEPDPSSLPNRMKLAAGTPGYVAPEQWNEGTISRASDIYGMGMVLGCALTDSRPDVAIRASSFAELCETMSEEERQLLALLDRMVAEHPDQRPELREISLRFSHRSFGTD